MLVKAAGIRCRYLCDENIGGNDHILAKILFDARCVPSAHKNYLSTGLPLLAGVSNCEIISTLTPVKQGHSENFYWAETETHLLLAYWGNEANQGGLQQATHAIYNNLLTEVQARGYPHLVRVWNYFADINRVEQGLERYRHFCIGRFNAFAAQGIAEEQYPSACALGHSSGDLLVYALASKISAQHFENPLQESAYHYPLEYGPRSPSFARASLLELPHQTPKIFVSGTASVMGFVTQHPDNLALQIKVTLENIECLLTHICAAYGEKYKSNVPGCAAEVIKVYVRNPHDLPEIKHHITNAYPSAPTVYLAAEICRADLLLEVDGIWNLVC